MGSNNSGSITYNKSRYNDDFYLQFNNENIIFYDHSLPEINPNSDWTIGFKTFNKNTSTNRFLLQPSGLQIDSFLQIRLGANSAGLSIEVNQRVNNASSKITSYLWTGVKYGGTEIIGVNVEVTYNTTNNTLKLFFNGLLAHTETNFSTIGDFTNSGYGLAIGGWFNNTFFNDGGLKDFFTLSKELTQSESSDIYKTNVLPQTCEDFKEFHTPLNSIYSKPNNTYAKHNINASSLGNSGGWNGGVLFSDKLLNGNDGYIEYTAITVDETEWEQAFVCGFTDLVTPLVVGDYDYTNIKYGMYTINAFGVVRYSKVEDGAISGSYPRGVDDVIKIERIGTTITYYVNGVTAFISTNVVTTELSPMITVFRPYADNIRDINLNGNPISARDDYLDIPIDIGTQVNLKGEAGFMLGWSDDEIGISNPSRISSFRDFYTKNQYYGTGIKYDGNLTSKFRGLIPNISTATTPPSLTNGFSMVFRLKNKAIGSDRVDIFSFSSLSYYTYFYNGGSTLSIFGIDGAFFNSPSRKISTFVLTVKNGGGNTIELWRDGFKVTSKDYASFSIPNLNGGIYGVSGNDRRTDAYYYLGMFDGVMSDVNIKEKTINEDWLSLNPTFFYSSENNGTEYIDQSSNLLHAPIQDPTYFQANQKYADRVGKPPVKYGLSFNGSQYLEVEGFVPTKEDGYTIITATSNLTSLTQHSIFTSLNFASDGFTNNYDIGKRTLSFYPDPNQELAYAVTPTDGSVALASFHEFDDFTNIVFRSDKITDGRNVKVPYLDGLNTKVRSNVTINGEYFLNSGTNEDLQGFDEIIGSITQIGARNSSTNLTGNILYMVVFKGILNDAEVKTLYNNGLFRQPWDISPDTQSELVLNVDFNNPYLDTVLKFPDLSPSNHQITATGWADLPTLEASRVKINSLR